MTFNKCVDFKSIRPARIMRMGVTRGFITWYDRKNGVATLTYDGWLVAARVPDVAPSGAIGYRVIVDPYKRGRASSAAVTRFCRYMLNAKRETCSSSDEFWELAYNAMQKAAAENPSRGLLTIEHDEKYRGAA